MTHENAANTETGSTDQAPAAPASPPRPAGGGRALGAIALLLSVAAVAASGYLWYQVEVEQKLSQNQLLTDMKDAVNTSKVEVTALEKEFDALRERQTELADRIETQVSARLDSLQSGQQQLSERSEALSASIEKVYEDLDRSLDSWALEEVEQLLRISIHSLQLSADVSTAIAGLELADQRLEELANPAFLEVREKLADNITALKNLEPVDVPGLALRLSGMASKVEDLPLAQKASRPIGGETQAAPETADEGTSEWLAAGGELFRDLKKLVRIQNIEEPAKPLLTPEQRYFLFSNLRLMLSGAQIAALRKDTPTFRENLEQAAQWLGEYFDTEHQGVQQLLGDMESMATVELSPDLPDISDSLTALRQSKQRVTSR
jgi:uroporphyrin-3 C-methyltransferase